MRAVVFDVDGTLYRQRPVRIRMVAAMLRGLLTGGLSLRDARILREYRRIREELADADRPPTEALTLTAERLGCSAEDVSRAEAEWLLQRALPYLRSAARDGVHELVAALRADGVRVIAWSDYPAASKIDALGLEFDFVVCAGDRDVVALKPNPAGLEKAMRLAGATPRETVMVGDRDERDGEAARRAGTGFVLADSRPIDVLAAEIRHGLLGGDRAEA
jgi:HAD superfamily hydrolase (TIGR01549 family)